VGERESGSASYVISPVRLNPIRRQEAEVRGVVVELPSGAMGSTPGFEPGGWGFESSLGNDIGE
jgi:hypothetical protein